MPNQPNRYANQNKKHPTQQPSPESRLASTLLEQKKDSIPLVNWEATVEFDAIKKEATKNLARVQQEKLAALEKAKMALQTERRGARTDVEEAEALDFQILQEKAAAEKRAIRTNEVKALSTAFIQKIFKDTIEKEALKEEEVLSRETLLQQQQLERQSLLSHAAKAKFIAENSKIAEAKSVGTQRRDTVKTSEPTLPTRTNLFGAVIATQTDKTAKQLRAEAEEIKKIAASLRKPVSPQEFSAETRANFVTDIKKPAKSALFQAAKTPETAAEKAADTRSSWNPTRLLW